MDDIKQVIEIEVKETGADKATAQINELNQSTENLQDNQSKATKNAKEQKAGFEDLGGGVGGAITQVKAFSKQLLLLLANPIILFLAAIVAALALVYKAFTSTNEGADKMDQIFASLGAAVDVLRDRVLQLFNALKSFDINEIIKSFSGLTEEIAKEAKRAGELAAALQEVEDATRDLGVSRAKLNRDLAESKEIITDETASYTEKKKAIEAVRIAEEKQTAAELANAKKKLAAIKEQNSLSDSSDEALQKEADAQAAVYALEQQSADNRRAIRKTEIRADNEEKARLKEIQAERNRISKERVAAAKKTADELLKIEQDYQKEYAATLATAKANRHALEDELTKAIDTAQEKNNESLVTAQELEIQLVNDKYFRLLELADQFGKDKTELEIAQMNEQNEINLKYQAIDAENEKKATDEKIANEQRLADAKKANKDQLLQQGEALIAGVAKLAGKNKAIQKAAIIADGGMSLGKSVANTAEAVTKDLAKGMPISIPLVAADVAVGAVSAASIIKGTNAALKAVGGGGNLSGSGAAASLPTRNVAQVGFQGSSENQISTAIAQQQQNQPPIEAFVVSQSVTDAQELSRKKELLNSF